MDNDLNNMTLQDLFAAFAMMGMLADKSQRDNVFVLAHDAYKCADAMIEVRETQNAAQL